MGRKNIRKLPENLISKIALFENNNVVVGCVRRIDKELISTEYFRNRGFNINRGTLSVSNNLLPDISIGRFCKKNVNGFYVVLNDQPKIPKSWDIEGPNYGDWSKGSHYSTITKMVHPRIQYSPKFLEIKVNVLAEEDERNSYIVRFQVNSIMNRNDPEFDKDLFFNLNLLLEFSGGLDVYEADAPDDQYLRSLFVDWEILPAGHMDETIQRIIRLSPGMTLHEREELIERGRFIESLHPRQTISGPSGFARYYGALFSDDLVVFENNKYGNASYVMFENWVNLSQRSRIDLLNSNEGGFVRVRHTGTWKSRLTRLINERLGNREQTS